MHMGRGPDPKIAHRTWLGAWLHRRSLIRRIKIGADVLTVYCCWFTDDNQFTRRKHWHVGHARAILSVRGAAAPRVRAASQGAYLLTISLTEPELHQLQEMAGGRSVQEFTVRAVLGLARTGVSCCHLRPADCIMDASRNARRETDAKAPSP
jgi:hypothetical protein